MPYSYKRGLILALCYQMAVLLIGSTGNGKSTLGNFLIDPTARQVPFRVATDNLPQTQHSEVVTAPITISGKEEAVITIVDTPGLNKGKEKDLLHMTDLVECLHVIKSVKACIVVVKFLSKIGQQYRDTLKYYSKLLPSLFSCNVLMVMTDYHTDQRSIEMRRKQGICFEEYATNVKKQIVESADMSYTPRLFAIDCLPFSEEENMSSQKIRKLILSHILSLQEVSVCDLEVAKTKAIEEEDQIKVKKCEGQLEVYRMRQKELISAASSVLDESKDKQVDFSRINTNLKCLRNRLSLKKQWLVYAVRVEYIQLQESISNEEANLRMAEKEAAISKERHLQLSKEIKSLEEIIETLSRDIKNLECSTMTVEQAHRRLAGNC